MVFALGFEGVGARLRGRVRSPAATAVDGMLGAVLTAVVGLGITWVLGALGARQRRRGAARGPAFDDPAASQHGPAAVERADRGAGAARPVPAHRRPGGARAGADGGDRPRGGRRRRRGLGREGPRQRLRAGRRGLGLGGRARARRDQRARRRGAEGHAGAAAGAPTWARRAGRRASTQERPGDPAGARSEGGPAVDRRRRPSRARRRRSSAFRATGPTTCGRGGSARRAR